MSETGQLAPHQQRLAEMLGKSVPPSGDPIAAGWKAELHRDPSTAIPGLQRTLDDHRAGAARSQVLADLAMAYSEDHRMAEPDDPEAAAFCDFCGSTTDLAEDDEQGSGDVPCACHHMVTRPCVDTGACVRRREARFPPSLDRVPQWIFDAQARIMDQDTASTLEASIAQACREFCLELTAAIEAEEIALAAEELELAARPVLPGWTAGNQYGAYDTRGDYIPQNFNWSHWNWRHTIRGGAPMHRTIANQQTPARLVAQAAVTAARSAQAAQGGSGGQPAPGGQGGQTAPEGVRAAIQGDAQAADIQLQQQGVHPDALPNRTQAQARAARRRGPVLRYSAGKRPRKPKQGHPGVDGSDSFGNSPDTGGPSGGAASAEVTG